MGEIRRHPAEVVADHLVDSVIRYASRLTAEEKAAAALLVDAFHEIGSDVRKRDGR